MGVNQIVCCSDFSDHAEVAFQTALDLAQRYSAKLYVVHVLPPVVNPMLTDTELMLPEHPDENLVVSLNERMQEVYGNRIPEKSTLNWWSATATSPRRSSASSKKQMPIWRWWAPLASAAWGWYCLAASPSEFLTRHHAR